MVKYILVHINILIIDINSVKSLLKKPKYTKFIHNIYTHTHITFIQTKQILSNNGTI